MGWFKYRGFCVDGRADLAGAWKPSESAAGFYIYIYIYIHIHGCLNIANWHPRGAIEIVYSMQVALNDTN